MTASDPTTGCNDPSCLPCSHPANALTVGCDANFKCMVATCEANYKPCGQSCAPIDDPASGCSSVECIACQSPHGTSTCTGGNCALLSCDPGYGDCAAPGKCQLLDADPNNCGACGHSCLGGGCFLSRCQPAEYPLLLASGEVPWAIALDQNYVYYTTIADTLNAGTVRQVDKGFTSRVVLRATEFRPHGVAVDDSYVFWSELGTDPGTNSGSVRRASKTDGSGMIELASTRAWPLGVAVSDVYVVWAEWGTNAPGNGGAYEIDNNGGGSVTVLENHVGNCDRIATNANASLIAWTNPGAAAGDVYYNAAEITSFAVGQDGLYDVAIPGLNVIWTAGGGVFLRNANSSTSPTPLDTASAEALAVDDTYAYYSVPAVHHILRIRLDGLGTPEEIAANLSHPRYIATDATAVFWTDDSLGTMNKLAK